MWKSLLNSDLKNLPKDVFFIILLFYPLFSFIVFEGTGIVPNYLFGGICYVLLMNVLYIIYKKGGNLNIPNYLIIFGVFVIYSILSSIFISNELIEKGAWKYFYSDSFIRTFIVLLIIENSDFSAGRMKFAIKVIGMTLFLAALVSVAQINNPLFLAKKVSFIEGLSYNRMLEYYKANPEFATGHISRTMNGYRLSIYSYIKPISVGIDNIALFSLLISLKSTKWMKSFVFVISAAMVSFLASARWVLLNFIIVASQQVWYAKNRILIILKYTFYSFILLILLIAVMQLLGIDMQKFLEERLLDDSAGTRVLAIEVFAKVFPDNPIFGTGGVDTEKVKFLLQGNSSQIHVGYLKLFYHYGLVGGLLYLTFLASLMVRLWKMAKMSKYWGGFFAFFAFAVANITLVEFSIFYYGLLLALIFSNYFYNESDVSLNKAKTVAAKLN